MEGSPTPPPLEESLRQIAEIRDAAAQAAHDIGVEAVQHGVLHRYEVAELLGIHPNTVGRWVTAAAAEAETPDES